MKFEERYAKSSHVIRMAIRKCRIYKNFEHYEQVGREAIWRAHEQFSGNEEDFVKYAYVFVRNALLNELRIQARKEEKELLIDDANVFEAIRPPCSIPPISEELEQLLWTLAKEDKQLLVALYVEDYSYEEAAKLFGITTHALKKRRDRLLKKLRQQKQIDLHNQS